jgi:hypothetical protein
LTDLRRFLPTNTKLYAHVMGWWGHPSHLYPGMQSNNPFYVERDIELMQRLGIQGIIQNWRGPNKVIQHQAALEYCYQSSSAGLGFILMLDGMTTDEALAAIAVSPELVERSEKYVLLWDALDPLRLQPVLPGKTLLRRNKQYAWPQVAQADPVQWLINDNQKQGMVIPAVFYGFDDSDPKDRTLSIWPRADGSRAPARIVSDNEGETLLRTCASVPQAAEIAQLVSWDDLQERTAFRKFAKWCL